MMIRLSSIKTKLLAFTIVVVLFSITITAVLGVYSVINIGNRSEQTTSTALRNQAETFLIQLTNATSEKLDYVFNRIQKRAGSMAEYASNIFENQEAFTLENYWRFDERMVKGVGGQYLNGINDTSSIFIPNYVEITDEVKKNVELNTALDFVVPQFLRGDTNANAMWVIRGDNVVIYYPNIGMGNLLPPDFVATESIFFTVANPDNNPERNVIWTEVYNDPAGLGVMITASAPIYTKSRFFGVFGIDVTLDDIQHNIEIYDPIEGSYAFLVDKHGHTIALPEQGYQDILGRSKESGEYMTNLSNVSNKFSSALLKMRGGLAGYDEITANNTIFYIAYSPLKETGFSIGIVVHDDILLSAVAELSNQIATSQTAIYFQIFLIVALITVVASIICYLMVNRFVKPINKLKVVADGLSKGNYDVQAIITSHDEIGQLASSFNKMAQDLKIQQGNLEQTVLERTGELQQKIGELEKYKRLTVDRELKMVELKKEINKLHEKIGEKP